MSDQDYFEDPGYEEPSGETFLDDEGNVYNEWEVQELLASGEYQIVEPPFHPDNTDEYGTRERELWPHRQEDRSAARHAAFTRMLNERRGS